MLSRRLHWKDIERLPDGMYADGQGLYLRVRGNCRQWILRYFWQGRDRRLSLGTVEGLTLAQARERARELRAYLKRRPPRDPAAVLAAERIEVMTFAEAFEHWFRAKAPEWTHETYPQNVRTSIERYALPILGRLPVNEITREHVLACLRPIWQAKPETASRVRMRIEAVLGWAHAHGLRDGFNPARWQDNLEYLLPAPRKVAPPKKQPALHWREAPRFWAELKAIDTIAARALRFLILTGVRVRNVRYARWREIAPEQRLWLIPGQTDYGQRMKNGQDFLVPLSEAAWREIADLPRLVGCEWVFTATGAPISDMTLGKVIRTLHEQTGPWLDPQTGERITAHGFRATLRSWLQEYARTVADIAEVMIGHTVGTELERTYARGDLLDVRRDLLERWARWLEGGGHG